MWSTVSCMNSDQGAIYMHLDFPSLLVSMLSIQPQSLQGLLYQYLQQRSFSRYRVLQLLLLWLRRLVVGCWYASNSSTRFYHFIMLRCQCVLKQFLATPVFTQDHKVWTNLMQKCANIVDLVHSRPRVCYCTKRNIRRHHHRFKITK